MGRLMRRAKFMMLGFQITAIIMGTQMVRAALKYERALRNVTSLMAGAGLAAAEVEANFLSMDRAIRGIAIRTGQMPLDLAEGMYNVVSATFDGSSALEVLEASALGAFAGMSSTNVVTGLLTKTLQAFRREGESNAEVSKKSMEVMDMFFMSVNRGMFTFDELASKFGSVTSQGAAFGISLQDMLAFLSTATVRGVAMDEALVGMRQTMLSVVSDSPAVAAAAEELFGTDVEEMWGAQALASKGLLGVLQGLNEKLPMVSNNVMEVAQAMEDNGGDAAAYMAEQLGLSVEAVTALFPNVRALKTVLAVTGAGMTLYAENMDTITESTGATQRAQDEMAKSASGALQFLKAAWETFKIDAGSIVLPLLKETADSIMGWWADLPAKFAATKGVGSADIAAGLLGDIEGARLQRQVEDMWAEASPSERVTFILKQSWRDGMDNLGRWFESGGEGRLATLGASISTFFTGIMDAVAGTTTEGAKDSLGYKFGEAFIVGFKNAWTDWVDGGGAEAFLKSTFGRIAAVLAGGMIGGPGGAIGAFVGSQDGSMMETVIGTAIGIGIWKYLLLQIGTGAAATGAAATGAAAATGTGVVAGMGTGLLAPLFTAAAVVMGTAWLTESALNKALDKQRERQKIDRAEAFDNAVSNLESIMSPEEATSVVEARPELQFAGGRPLYGFGGGFAKGGLIDWAQYASEVFGAANKQQTAADTMITAAAAMASSMSGFAFAGISLINGNPPDDISPPPPASGGGTSNHRFEAHGSSGTVRRPTLFVAGEAGPEHYSFVPTYKGKGGGGGGGVTINGPLIGQATISNELDVREVTAQIVREFEKAVGNG